MKILMRLICMFKGHNYMTNDWRYNPHTELWKQTCTRCANKKYINDKDINNG
jgi:hypothetical protein